LGKGNQVIRKTWREKICIEHPEFAVNEQYPAEIKKTIEDPDYMVNS